VRTYAPAGTETVLARLLEEPSLANAVTHHARLPEREAITAPFPQWLDARIVRGLEDRGITSLYSHQAEAVEAVHAGEDVVVVTPTASGKTLCYTLPVLQALAEDPSARALFLFPTKALGQDQVAEFAELARASSLDVAAATYDGDTPAPIRSAIRTAGQVVVTNPDMLHSAILPHHTKWFQLFEQVRVIVIDELHTYRGVFGSHVANVLRRLLRLCAHYGSNPIIVCSSATIGNPAELAAQLTGRTPHLIDRNGAPAGARHVLLVDPPLLDQATGARGSALTHAQRWALPFLRAGRQTIVFGRARVAVEILLTGIREALREHLGPRSRIRGYRGGYLPTERRAIERGLRDGEILGVVSTNALELGVDIGALDVSVLAGYPGSVAATWQQLGRAGRRLEPSVGILVASGSPVDQYVIHHPEFLLEGTPEEARIDPDNLHVLIAHLRCATFERPFEPADVFGPGPVDDLLAFIAEAGHVRQASDGRWYWSSENFPASEVSLRTAAPENVVIIDTTPDRPRVIGETDLFSAQVLVHTQAIYLHESVQYHVDKLDWGERKAYVRRVDVDYYTYANRAVTLKPLDVFATAEATGGRRIHGEVMVASLVTLFKKLKFGTDENVGWGPIDLPELELQTTAYWLTYDEANEPVIRTARGVGESAASAHAPDSALASRAPRRLASGAGDGLGGSHPDRPGRPAGQWRKDDLDVALLGAGRAIQAVAAVLLMCDPRDLGLVTQVRSPHSEAPTIYLYEAVPGGIGLSERLWKRHDELVVGARALIEACGCDSGCPACTGPRLDPEVDGKALALRLLRALIPAARGVGDSAGSAHVPERTLADRAHRRPAPDRPQGPERDAAVPA
jgi:DEAD/DEAH box helicase domain-containing protein